MSQYNGIRRFIYLTQEPVSSRNFQRFGVQTLFDNGFDITYVNTGPIIGNKYNPQVCSEALDLGIKLIDIQSKSDLVALANELTPDDFIMVIVNISAPLRPFFRLIKKRKIETCVFSVVAPQPERLKTPSSLLRRIRRFLYYLVVDRAIIRRWLFDVTPPPLLGLKPFDYGVATNNAVLQTLPRLWGRSTKVIKSHSCDYELFMNTRTPPAQKAAARQTLYQRLGLDPMLEYAVFLDQMIGCHPDAELETDHNKLVDVAAYYEAFNAFFARMRKSGLPVVIAGHPRSLHARNADKRYPGAPFLIGESCQLIEHARIVMVHNSASMSFAVLHEKPMVFVTCHAFLAAPGLQNDVVRSANLFGQQARMVESIETSADLCQDSMNINRYHDFRNLYLRAEGAEDVSLWQGVVNALPRTRTQ